MISIFFAVDITFAPDKEDTSLNKIIIKSSSVMLVEVAKGIITGTFKDEFKLELDEIADLRGELLKTRTEKEKHEAEIKNLQSFCKELKKKYYYWKKQVTKSEYFEDGIKDNKFVGIREVSGNVSCNKCQSLEEENEALKTKLRKQEQLVNLRDAEILLLKNM